MIVTKDGKTVEYGTRLVIQWNDKAVPEVREFYGDGHGQRAIDEFKSMAVVTERLNHEGKTISHYTWPGTSSHVFMPVERDV